MSIEADVVTYLASKTTVTAYVGTPNPRIFPQVLPQKLRSETRYQAIVYRTLDDGRMHDLSGAGGLAQPTIQLIAVSDDYGNANDLAQAIRGVMQGVGGVTFGSTTKVLSVVSAGKTNDFQDLDDGSDKGVHAVAQNYRILYEEPAP